MVQLYRREGSPYWYARFYVGQVLRRVSTEIPAGPSTRRKALAIAEKIQNELEQTVKLETGMSFGHAALLYLDGAALKQSTRDLYKKKLDGVLPHLKRELLGAMTPERVRQFVNTRCRETTGIQIRKELTVISQVMEWSIDMGFQGAPEVNPVRLISRRLLAKPDTRPRAVTVDEARRLMAAVKGRPFWEAFLTLLFETGMRHEEALGLKWDEVDLDAGIIRLPPMREKTQRGRFVPLSHAALAAVQAQAKHTDCAYVFVNARTGKRYTSIYKEWGRIRKNANCSQVRIHDIRHTFASWTRSMGMDRLDRKGIMGHSSNDSHEIYAVPDPAALRRVVNRFSPSTLLAQPGEPLVDKPDGE